MPRYKEDCLGPFSESSQLKISISSSCKVVFQCTVISSQSPFDLDSSGSRGVPRGGMAPPALYKQVIKKMAAKGGHIDFMFFGPPHPAAGSDAVRICILNVK